MARSFNLQAKLEANLPAERMALLHEASDIAGDLGLPLYLVGGAVRDLLIEQPLQDMDLVVEGDAALLAHALAKALAGEVLAYSQFSTAKAQILGQRIDLVTARYETYRRPGALPTVRPSGIQDDLARRDFTINAMAIRLAPAPSGELLDPIGGRRDIQEGLVRVLHSSSFQDDATRILRAVRYEQRLGFRLEPETAAWLRRDLAMLDTISGSRLRRELDLTFHEQHPHHALTRMAALGVLHSLYPPLDDGRAAESELARLRQHLHQLQAPHYLAWLAYPLESSQAEDFIARLAMPKDWAAVVRNVVATRQAADALDGEVSPVTAYQRLKDLTMEAIQVVSALEDKPRASDNLNRYVHEWRSVRPLLTGRDLVRLGVPQGPRVGKLLEELLEARLEGHLHTRDDEEARIRHLWSNS